ncbi:MAG: rRNA maturation RNase YbeY [Bacillota bacterium]|nr:rRNA maturation RNase YbeY [Bacillota bacterium]
MVIWMEDSSGIGKGTKATLSRAADLCLQAEKLEEPQRYALSLTVADEEEIRQINRDFRGIDRVTDVLSFPQFEGTKEIRQALPAGYVEDGAPGEETAERSAEEAEDDGNRIPLGDVVICRERIRQQAEEYGHSERRELVYLFVHSVLHLLGYDHMEEEDKRRMRAREEEIMTVLGIAREKEK